MSKTYFFTFGDDNYKNSKIRIEKEAKNFGFDCINIYGPENLSQEFLEKTRPWIDMPRGKGYWLWKAFLLKKTFEMMEEGDFVTYVDAGCTISLYGKETYNGYLKMLEESDSGMIRFSYEKTPEEMFTNESVFEYFGKKDDIEFRRSDILMNGIFVMKKCENSIKYVEEFYKVATEAPVIFSDEHNSNHCECYKDHRHDQSVSSCLVKLNGNFIQLDDHSYGSDYNMWMDLVHNMKIPFLATRIRG